MYHPFIKWFKRDANASGQSINQMKNNLRVFGQFQKHRFLRKVYGCPQKESAHLSSCACNTHGVDSPIFQQQQQK